jgi:hypothetical protein
MERALTKFGLLALLGGLAACAGTSKDGGGNRAPFDLPGSETPAPAQGAGAFTVLSASPAPAGKVCPVVVGTAALPEVPETEALDADTYLHHITDGEDSASFHCRVSGASSFTFAGVMQRGGISLEIGDGVLGADRRGTAEIKLGAATTLPSVLSSDGACSIDASLRPDANFQVKRGSIWAGFSCPSVQAPPSDYCTATGFFVLENCEQ